MQYDAKIRKAAKDLYRNNCYCIEDFAKRAGIDVRVIKYLLKGLNMYVDPQFKCDPRKVAKQIEQESKGLVKYTTMLGVIVDFIKDALRVYYALKKSAFGSRKGFAQKFGLDWSFFEDFYWRNELDSVTNLDSQLKELEKIISS